MEVNPYRRGFSYNPAGGAERERERESDFENYLDYSKFF